MAKKDIPQKWTGDEVEVSIRTDVPEESTGKLREVNDAGIVVAFTVQKEDGKDYGRTVFYPCRSSTGSGRQRTSRSNRVSWKTGDVRGSLLPYSLIAEEIKEFWESIVSFVLLGTYTLRKSVGT